MRLSARKPGVIRADIGLRRATRDRELLARAASRFSDDGSLEGHVVSFDDVTDLVAAQRMAAWGDVARRIAHEVKNPLTPIQLSAERIRRKLRPLVGDQQGFLDQYTDVIVRQTNDLRRIVDEFSKFARMPAPERKQLEINKLVSDAVVLQEAGRPEIIYTLGLPDHAILAQLDATMIGQALTNLLKNAAEAIDEKKETNPELAGEIRITLSAADDSVIIDIQDNGAGLPDQTSRLFEPYVTHREKGTGLGLPIVKKIIEEHGGTLELRPAPSFSEGGRVGAWARIVLPQTGSGVADLDPDSSRDGSEDDKNRITEKLRESMR
jgi:two-component system nitrogen regulation sensor histidine kinase NtrY